jgi:hypothetical protein
MKVRFIGTKKQDSATVRRRLLQANHTRNYRNRQKARKDTTTANHQGELLSDAVGTVAENELLEPKKDSLPDTVEIEENGICACDNFKVLSPSKKLMIPPSVLSSQTPCYGEEIVDIYSAEENEDQRQPQSPQIYAEESADLANDDAKTDVEYTTQKFIQQFLAGIHGCSAQSHRESLTVHIEAEGPDNHHGLDRLVPQDVPTVQRTIRIPPGYLLFVRANPTQEVLAETHCVSCFDQSPSSIFAPYFPRWKRTVFLVPHYLGRAKRPAPLALNHSAGS